MRAAEEYLRPEVIQEVARLDLKAKFIVEGFISGLHDSPYHGFSSEFSEHRRYNVGDDLRNIDWKVYGRTDRLYVKRFEAETNLSCCLLLDVSESMGYSYGGAITKLDYSTYMSAAFGYMMVKVDWSSFERYEYITRTCLGEMTGEIFIEKALEFVNTCPRPENVASR